MKLFQILLAFLLVGLLPAGELVAQKYKGAIKVEIKESENGWQLLRGGEPYYIKGVGGQEHLDRAKAYGANSVRTWNYVDAAKILDEAHDLGLSVLVGLWVGVERQGFDYDDSKAVKAQFENFKEVVKKYKDHPAVLMWGIGNENDLMYSDYKVWNAINDIAKMIHEVDPNHPTMTVTAGLDVAEVQLIKERAPHIDVYGINTYRFVVGLDEGVRSYGWDGPYIIAEWGPWGHWESPTTEWGAPIEQTSSEKAETYRNSYENGIIPFQDKCIGSYTFLWGAKQETTPTWYGMFTLNGEESEVMDVMEYCWTGKWPENRAPKIKSLTIDGKKAIENVYLSPNKSYEIFADVQDPEKEDLTFEWVVLETEFGLTGAGGDAELAPDAVRLATVEKVEQSGGLFNEEALKMPQKKVKVDEKSILSNRGGKLEFTAPRKEGAYRFFVYAYDNHGNVATGNIPFYVKR
jgi:hypothetical protein